MTLHVQIFNPEKLPRAYQNKKEFSGAYCPFCKVNAIRKIRRYKNTRSIYYHIRLEHKDEVSVDVITSILHFLSFAIDLEMIQ
jgi:hypothetical protein